MWQLESEQHSSTPYPSLTPSLLGIFLYSVWKISACNERFQLIVSRDPETNVPKQSVAVDI